MSELLSPEQRRRLGLVTPPVTPPVPAQAPSAVAVAAWLGMAAVLLIGAAGVALALAAVVWSVRLAWRLAVGG